MVSCAFLTAVLVALVAVAFYSVSQRHRNQYLPWHKTEQWRELLEVYDEALAPFSKATMIPTDYGLTNVMMRGHSNEKLVLLFHGAGSNNLIYRDWILPQLAENNCVVVAVDFVCDTTRSVPKDGRVENCPQTEAQLVDWVQQVVENLPLDDHIKSAPPHVAGYSYGAYIAFAVALHTRVDKLVLMAPASVVAPIEFAWIGRALVYGLTRSEASYRWFLQYMLQGASAQLSDLLTPFDWKLMHAIRKLGATVLAVQPQNYDDDALQNVFTERTTSSLLLIGQDETVTNSTIAAERAQQAGARTKVYPNAGHLMIIQKNEEIERDVVEFLVGRATL